MFKYEKVVENLQLSKLRIFAQFATVFKIADCTCLGTLLLCIPSSYYR